MPHVHKTLGGVAVKSSILFKEDNSVRPDPDHRSRKAGANDNLRSLEFEADGQGRDWRLPCLIAAISAAFAAFIFLPMW